MKKNLKFKISFFVSLSVILIAIVTSMVYAFISTTSTRGEIEVSAATITAETTYTATGSSFDWIYTEAGDTKQINITTSNQTGVILHRFYNIELNTESTSDANLLKAIIVYYNDNYIGTLNDIVDSNPDIEEEYNFIGISSNKTDNFKFELHQAAINSIFNAKNVKITITTYTENADYFNYIFVNNESEFAKAIDDVNSGLFENIPSIVLCSNITLENSYTISNPVTIHLNGSTLNGALTINDTVSTNPDALLEVLGTGTFNVSVTLGSNYDTTGAVTLVKNHIKEVLASGLAAGSTTDILGYYSFYGVSIAAVTRCTYTAPNVIIANTANEYYNALGSVRVNNDENISFKILGTKTALLDETLAYMPEDGATITSDLFLPTYIPSQNANITWTSSDESIITSTGMITADRLENAEVTLYAEIKVNETIITRRYNFKVSAHNNEINFYKLVQEISPIVINNVRNSAADDDDALYHLPIINVDSNGDFGNYDYRTSYQSPVNTKMFDWQAFKDIGLENITYSMELDSNDNIKYDYITLANGNELYLNTITLNNFARIVVTGDFGNHETYTTYVNISISVGSNTQLLEKAFTQVSEELETISVLGNILSTRIKSGMKNEKGDFSLSHEFTDKETNTINEDYTIEYSGAEDIISSITYNSTTKKYDFAINPEYFNEYETTVAFTATVYYLKGDAGQTSKSRTFYVTVPAALHISDFGTISIYNSTKYQVFNQLPSNEKGGTTGYTASGTLTDSNLNYILLRDIVGDANYLTQYDKGNGLYLTKINYTSSNYASGTESLSYQTASDNPTSTTDTAAYDFARLIEWATGNTRVAASTVVSNTTALDSYASNKANAEDYLNDDEIAVLKQYYCSSTGATEAQWNSLFSEVFNVAPGYIYTNPALLNTVIAALGNNGISFKSSTTNYSSLFGKYMEVLQRYAVSTTKVNDNDVAPCQEQYNSSYLWYHSSTSGLTSFRAIASNGTTYTSTVDYTCALKDGTYWYRGGRPSGAPGASGSDGGTGGFYATSAYASDRTSYITAAEYQVVMMFWLNVCAGNLNTSITNANTTKIQSALTENSEYYSNYAITDFDTVGKAIINAFDACMEIPTYFAADGVAKIIKSFYDRKDYKLPSYDGAVITSFGSSLNGNIPYITNADNIKSVLSYFVNLKTLTFNGNANLAVFLSENGLSTVFARTGLYNKEITSLTMKHVAHSSVNFDLTNIKNFTKLTTLDLSNNSGIQSVNELVNVNRRKYTLVNIEQIGVEYEYQAFAIDNIATPDCTVRYTDAVGTNTYSNDNSRASDLANLSDFNKFITKYMYMTNVIYNDDGTTTTVTWRIDEGNEINSNRITNGGNYPSISTIDEMNQFVSPYYYCSQSFTYNNISFDAGNYYRVYYENGVLKSTLLGNCIQESTLNESTIISEFNIDTSLPDSSVFNKYKYRTKITTEESTTTEGTKSNYNTSAWYNASDGNNDPSYNITITISNSYYLKMTNKDYPYGGYLWYWTSQGILDADDDYYADNIFFIDYETAYNIKNNKYYQNTTITGKNYNSITEAGKYYMCLISNNELYFVGSIYDNSTNDTSITIVSYLDQARTIRWNSNRFTFDNDLNLRLTSSGPRYHSQTNNCEIAATVKNNFSFTTSTTLKPFFEVTYKDGTTQTISAYAVGYRIYKCDNSTHTYTETESTYLLNYNDGNYYYFYYSGNNQNMTDEYGNSLTIKSNTILGAYANYTYPVVSRSRSYVLSGTFYTWSLWYTSERWLYNNFIQGYNDASGYIDGSLIESVKLYYSQSHLGDDATLPTLPANTTTRTNGADWDDWSTTLTSNWQYDKLRFIPYISYVSNVSGNSHQFLDNQVGMYSAVATSNIDHIYEYSGVTGTTTVYNGESASYTTTYNNNYGYKLVISNNQLSWNQNSTSVTNPTGTTMDSILTNANKHFKDFHYGEYYGKYYGYNGNNLYSALGYYYEKGYIYRIMPNESNTAFTWVKVSSFMTDTSGNILKALGTGQLNIGDICYSTAVAFSPYFSAGWYKVILDEKTNIVNLVKFNDLGFTTNGATTYTRLTNDKLVARSGDYLGYSGTFTVQISAMIRVIENGVVVNEYIKTYKLKFVGSLTS